MAERPREAAPSLMFQGLIAMVCTALGLYCSTLVFGPPQPLSGSHDQPPMSCDELAAVAALPSHASSFMGTKLPYQFVGVVKNETTLNSCTAEKVWGPHGGMTIIIPPPPNTHTQLYGVLRHGSRYPSPKYLPKWAELVKRLRASNITTSLGAELVEWVSFVDPSQADHVTPHGLREQYCLARRFQTRWAWLV